jgi:hypothetical protein
VVLTGLFTAGSGTLGDSSQLGGFNDFVAMVRAWSFESVEYVASATFSAAEFDLTFQKLLVMSILSWSRDPIVFNLLPTFLATKHLGTVLLYPGLNYLFI